MPIGFSDLLKTTAQLDNNLTKGIVNTDETYGGIRSKIDDWTDLHLSTFNSGSGYTYQDDGTPSAPGHFKAYSTMFYVADGRSLVEDSTASADFIRLDASGNYVASGGTKYVVDSGDASPGYYVLKDATQVGGTGTGKDKLPKFSITGAQGSDTSTALPAGYESFTSANNSSPAIEVTDTNDDTNFNLVFSTAGTDQSLFVDATTGVLQYNPSSGTLNVGTSIQSLSLSTGTFGATGDIVSDLIPGNANGAYAERDLGSSSLPWHELYVKDAIYFEGTANEHETQIVATEPTADNVITLPNATGTLAFENADTSGTAGALATAGTITFTGDVVGGSTPTYTSGGDLSIAMTIQPDSVGLGDLVDITDERLLGRVSAVDGSVAQLTKAEVLTMLDVEDGAQVNVGTNLAIGTNDGTTQQVTSSTGSNVSLLVASASKAGIVTNAAQTFAGEKTFSNNVIIGGNLTVAGDVIQQDSTTVVFNDTFLDLNVANSASTYATNSGFRFARKTDAANSLEENAALTYDASADQFKFTRHTDSATGAVGSADNVASLKFTKSDAVSQTNQADGLTTMPDDDFANVASVRSLGAVAKCSITITNQTDNSGSNFAPDIQGTNGYVIKHNLNTTSVYVVAIKDPSGTATPVFCKYSPIDANIVRVTVGVTTDNEVYDIIVIG